MPDRTNVVSGSINSGTLRGCLRNGGLSGAIGAPDIVQLADYNLLVNKPQINGATLTGNKTSEDLYIVSENTTAGWNENPQYLPKKGEICVYTDYQTAQDDMGNTLVFQGIKIGDGNSYLIDMPFVGEEDRYLILRRLQQHENNTAMHLQPGEREFWNNKLNYDVTNEELILTRN